MSGIGKQIRVIERDQVTKKTGKPVKHIPQRTCVGCRQVLPKRSLIRVVRSPQGVRVDPTGKAAGRGAYVHNQRSCWETALKGSLPHALKTELTEADRAALNEFMQSLSSSDEE